MKATEHPRNRDRLRTHVYERDDYRCQRCGQQGGPHEAVELHVRGIVPESRGGTTNHPRNLLTLCGRCRDRVSDHHVLGSGDRITQQVRAHSSGPSSRAGGRIALLFFGGVLMPFLLTLLVMSLNPGFP